MDITECEYVSTEQDNFHRRISEFSELLNQTNPEIVQNLPERVKSRVIDHLSQTDPSALDQPLPIIRLPSRAAHPYLYYTLKPIYVMYLIAHYLGGKLSWLFGITSPAYQDTIDMMEQQLEREEMSDDEDK